MKSFLKEAEQIVSNKKALFAVMLAYAAIFLAIFALSSIFSFLFFSQRAIIGPVAALVSAIAYFLLAFFSYSFFKTIVLDMVKKGKIKKKSFSNLGGFFWFNIVTSVISGIIALAAAYFVTFSFNDSPTAGAVFIAVSMVFYYPFINFSQLEFFEKGRIFKSLGNGWQALFSKRIGRYFAMLLCNVIVIAAYFLVFSLIGLLYRAAFITGKQNPSLATGAYNLIFSILLAAIVIFLLSFNMFYLKKLKG